MAKIILFFLFFYTIFWLFLTFRITDVPPGINGDEAAIGYNAALVARTGHDQSGRFLPLFVSAFDLTDWKQPITFYTTVLAFKIFGPSYALLREVSIVLILLSATLIFLLSYELAGFTAAFVSLFVFMTIPSILIQSHLALENIAPVPFITLWLLMITKYKKSLDQKFLIFSGMALGISLFTYPGMRLIFPVLCVVSILFIYYLNRNRGKEKFLFSLKFLVVIAIFPIFMLLIKNQYPGAILAYNRPRLSGSYQELIMPYISSFDPSFLFISGDTTSYHSTGRQGVFLLATLPIFILGITTILQKKDLMLKFILLIFFISPILYGLAGTIHRGSRLLMLLPPYTIIASIGLLTIINMKNKVVSYILTMIVILLVVLNYTDFVRDYWYEYPKRVKSDFSKPIHLAFEKFYQLSKDNNLKPFIQPDLPGQNQIAFDFFEQVYFHSGLSRWNKVDLPKDSIILADDPDILSKRLENVKIIRLEEPNYFLLMNTK